MYKKHFGLTHPPLGKESKKLWENEQLHAFSKKFRWLLDQPGIGVLTAEPGLGKTAMMRQLTQALNPHRYQVVYVSETNFSRLEFYRQLALVFGLQPRYRRTQQWKELKERLTNLMESKHILPILIIDEAQNLSSEFFCDFPSFLNFAFDSRDMMTVWFLGHPTLDVTLGQVAYEALESRISVRHQLHPIDDKEAFAALIKHGFEEAGCHTTLLSDSGLELVRVASRGIPRGAYKLLVSALRMAADKGLNHLPDDIIQSAILMLKGC